jgi:hypothetical protein
MEERMDIECVGEGLDACVNAAWRYMLPLLVAAVMMVCKATGTHAQQLPDSIWELGYERPLSPAKPESAVQFSGSIVPAAAEEITTEPATPAAPPVTAAAPAASPDGCDSECQDDCNCWFHGSWLSQCFVVPSCKRPGEITFKPGLRIQGRYLYDTFTHDNDFFIRRFRMKGSGNVYDIATYGAELKVDSSEKFNVGNPNPIVENAWVDFTVCKEQAYLRVGLYDIPFSRNCLTSDSKLLLMDRTLIFDALSRVGMADNTVGLMLHGRPLEGRLEYAVGIFDNIKFDRTTANSQDLMPAGRIAWYILDPAVGGSIKDQPNGYADYRESYLGQGHRLVLAANFASLPEVVQGVSEFDLHAWGVDLFYNTGPYVFQAEYDWFREDGRSGTSDLQADGWYVQAGYILNCCWELTARYQFLDDPINPVNSSERVEWTSIGLNYYIHEHNLKIQMDYTWKNEREEEIDNDTLQVQLQLDF